MASAESISAVADIIVKSFDGKSIYVVVSAFAGMTDLLIEMTKAAEAGEDYDHKLAAFWQKADNIASSLLSGDSYKIALDEFKVLHKDLEKILYGVSLIQEASGKSADYILSFGERVSATMLNHYLVSHSFNSQFIDARQIIKTDQNFGEARVNFEFTNKAIRSRLSNDQGIFIITGFIGSDTETGRTTTIGRGGSDYTAAIVAAALDVEELQIWTDVSGVLSSDPRKVSKAHTISELSYQEALELSHFGAKVLYAPTVRPVQQKNIPTRIKNTFDPSHPGTLIHSNKKSQNGPIAGISSIDDISLISLEGTGLQGVTGTASRLFDSLARMGINVIMITQASSEHSITIAVLSSVAKKAKSTIEKEFNDELLRKIVEPIKLEEGMSLIAVVGENMKNQVGLAGSVFSVLGKNGVNIEAIAQGSSELNISFAVASQDQLKALNSIHDSFFLSDYKSIHLYIVGTGLVGMTLLKMIEDNSGDIRLQNKIDIQVNGIANSRNMLIQEKALSELSTALTNNKNAKAAELPVFISKMINHNFANSIFIDNTAGDIVPRLYEEILSNSIAISTPNKVALSSSFKDYEKLKRVAAKNKSSINYETNVGAGLPVISTLKNLLNSGDKVNKIEAILSGSLSYIFNSFDGSVPFSELVLLAKNKGFTEPDPREDLSGKDVCRKLLILARECGHALEIDDIEIAQMFDKELMSAASVDDFFHKLSAYDQRMNSVYSEAVRDQKKLRFMAEFDGKQAKVGLRSVSADSPFYNLSGSDNMIAFYTNRYASSPLLIQGPGAGAEVTAAGILAEILNIAVNP